jgi:2-polyprenyl-6-methoxyphenol hydroxylase-like FAD-dependent oxidoreductase
VLQTLDWGFEAGSGWHSDYSLFQPFLEELLDGQAARHGNVRLLRGWQAEKLAAEAGGVLLECRRGGSADGTWTPSDETTCLTARYVVGCDGANSMVQNAAGVSMTDFGFEADWLVVFVEPHDRSVLIDMPDVAQILDPARPTSAFRSSGKRFCRWEFMLMPGETPESMSDPDVAWKLVERWGVTPRNSRLVRNSVFRFRSMVASRLRAGRLFLAGDAAHLMPPFLGQGLCSGLRDAKTLSWKLDLVLRGLAPDSLLDSYDAERRPHAAAIVRGSLAVGEVISVTDPAAAAERDARLRSGAIPPPGPLPSLTDGVLLRDAGGVVADHAGVLSVQPRIRYRGRSGRADDIVGTGWAVFTTGWDAEKELSPASQAILDTLRGSVRRIEDAGDWPDDVAVDLGGRFTAWARAMAGQAAAVIVRPDFYTFAVAADAAALEEAVQQLGRQLGMAAA